MKFPGNWNLTDKLGTLIINSITVINENDANFELYGLNNHMYR